MYIGKISKITGASIKAIRFYEEIGLLNKVKRSGPYRVYNEDHIILIQLILKAKSLGFKLSEIKEFTKQKNNETPWNSILQMIINKVTQIDSMVTELNQQKEELSQYKKNIMKCLTDTPDCSLFQNGLDSPLKGRQ